VHAPHRNSILRSVVVGFISLGVMAEVMHSRAASRRVPEAGSTSVVVLGYPSWRGGRPHPVQRWRVKLAKKTIDRHGADRVVLSGGPTRSGPSEASMMAKLAVEVGIDPTITILESESMNTWSNVMFSSTLVADSAVVILVSDPVHAAWARRYWLRQHPSDADRVFVTPCAGLGSWWMKIPTALDGFRRSAQSVLRTLAYGHPLWVLPARIDPFATRDDPVGR
jgi:vancomycin permeability regulator SanA